MSDVLEALLANAIARRMFKAHGKTWMALRDVPGDGPTLYFAVECTEKGEVQLPATVQIVKPDP